MNRRVKLLRARTELKKENTSLENEINGLKDALILEGRRVTDLIMINSELERNSQGVGNMIAGELFQNRIEKIAELKKQNSKLKREINILKDTIVFCNTRITVLNSREKVLDKARTIIQEKNNLALPLSNACKRITDLEKEITVLNARDKVLDKARTTIQERNSLKVSLSNACKRISAMQYTIHNLNNDCYIKENYIDELNTMIRMRDATITELQKENESLRDLT